MKKSLIKTKSESQIIKRNMLPMNLQFFADGDADDASNDDDASAESSNEDEFEAPASKSELDSIIGKAVNTALANAKKKSQKEIDDAIKSALQKEKDLSQLSEEDRKKVEVESERTQFETEKAEFEFEKLVLQTQKDLIEKSLPADFAEWLAVAGDSEKTLENIKTFEAKFKSEVAEQVKVSLRQKTPGFSGGSTSSTNYGAQVAKKTGAAPSGTLF